jgi:hypothetical protein
VSVIVGLAALAALQLSNLLYVAAAIVAAILISALIALRHRRPKSLESGIESFSRELRALAPEADGSEERASRPQPRMTTVAVRPRRPAATRGTARRPPGEHYRDPAGSSLSDGEQPKPEPPGSFLGPGGPGAAEEAPARTDGQTG